MHQTILRLADVKARTGLSRSTIYALVKSGHLKRPVALGPRAVGWPDSDIEEFITSRIAARDAASEGGAKGGAQ
jgi:prophage regulatory protein